MPTVVAAVDFGATSTALPDRPRRCRNPLEVVHRYAHHPVADARGTLRWDWGRLVAEMERGLDRARARGPLASIGIDAWAVDYGLVGADGGLVEPPVSYRDQRTAGYRDVVERIGERRLYEIAGLQLMPINTIFQLAAHDRDALSRARHLLMLPELLAYHLSGEITAELTSAGSTGLFDLAPGTGPASCSTPSICRRAAPVDPPAGTLVGKWRDAPVHLVGGHDTASAVLGGAAHGAAYVSAGTWLLVGRMLAKPDTSEATRLARFSNEQGAAGGIRLLRNVAGWWLVEECRRTWGDPDLDELLAAAASVGPVPAADATDPRFLAPDDMAAELVAAAGLGTSASRAEVVRCAVESMAQSTAAVVAQLGLPSVQVFGGGARSELLLQLLAEHVDGSVTVGPVEATALGNAMSQGLALGVFDSVAEARRRLVESHATSVDQAVVP